MEGNGVMKGTCSSKRLQDQERESKINGVGGQIRKNTSTTLSTDVLEMELKVQSTIGS